MRPNPNVIVATPCYGGMVTQRYMQCLIMLLQNAPQRGFSVGVELLGYDSLIPRARNTLVARFLEIPDASHLLFIDADIGFEWTQIERMLRFDEDVVAGMYPLKIFEWTDAAVARIAAGEPVDSATLRYVGVPKDGWQGSLRDGFAPAEFAGGGFLMVKRTAIERMIAAYPQSRYSAAHNFAEGQSGPLHALFETMIDPDTREYLSEDFAFCRRWRDIGGSLWLDMQSQLRHIGGHEFSGDAGVRYLANLASGDLGGDLERKRA